MSIIYPWAEPDYVLDNLSLDQLISFHNYGWKAKETEARLHWGILGELMSGKKGHKQPAKDNLGFTGLNEFKKAHPEAENVTGAWKVNK